MPCRLKTKPISRDIGLIDTRLEKTPFSSGLIPETVLAAIISYYMTHVPPSRTIGCCVPEFLAFLEFLAFIAFVFPRRELLVYFTILCVLFSFYLEILASTNSKISNFSNFSRAHFYLTSCRSNFATKSLRERT